MKADNLQNIEDSEIISIVIPVYRSTKSLEILAEEINKLGTNSKYNFEIIFVNDSPFHLDTLNVLNNLQTQYDNIQNITLRKNQGQHIATLVGMSKAVGKYIVTMDDDLQHSVKDIPHLIECIISSPGIEAVFGVPDYKDKKHNFFRNSGSFLLNKIDVLFLDKPKGLVKSSFRIITADLGEIIVKNHNAMPAISSLIIKTTDNIKNLKISHLEREFGKSNYSIKKLISLTLDSILHYSSLPLKAVGVIGFVGLFFSIIFIITILIRKFFIGFNFPGYASTVILISFFGGLNLMAVGLIGEYLIRIIREQQKSNIEDLIKR